jgi:hypothetical protein
VQVLLGNFEREGIVWAQLPANALSAALKRYPNAGKIRLFWDERTIAGGQWSDERSTILFAKNQGDIRFFTKTESYYADQLHYSNEFLELRQVTPHMIHSISSSFTAERQGNFSELLQTGGAQLERQKTAP